MIGTLSINNETLFSFKIPDKSSETLNEILLNDRCLFRNVNNFYEYGSIYL